jgi:transcription initiation protein SPT3
MFVFGEVQDPNIETVNLVEDIVRSQLIELVRLFLFPMSPCFLSYCRLLYRQIVQARALATRRGARYLNAEDLIFLIRHDRGKVNRLRTYLSWKDVRKHAKDSGGDGGAAVDVEPLDDGPDGEFIFNICHFLRTHAMCFFRQVDGKGSEDYHQASLGD